MKKAIALRGRGKVGKSQTIRKVYDLLRSEDPTAATKYLKIGVDVRVILAIKGIGIGIESQGDPGGRLERSLDLFVREGCQVIVCATRTAGMTVDAVDRLHLNENYDLLWLDQTVVSDPLEQEPKNLQKASTIVAEVKRGVGGDRASRRTAAVALGAEI